MIGRKVKMTKNYAKWVLDHPEAFIRHSIIEKGTHIRQELADFYLNMQMASLVILGGEMVGEVVRYSHSGDLYVEFSSIFGCDRSYYELGRDVKWV